MSESSSRYGVIIQARTTSTRLPGKVLMDIAGLPMLYRQVDRLRHALNDLPLVVATSEDSSDDAVEALCSRYDVSCFRGSLNNVLQRFIDCGEVYSFDYVIRVGGDDPLIDPNCCKHIIALHTEEKYDFMFASNRQGWPYGTAAELISVGALKTILASTQKPFYLEHIVPYFHDNPEKFRILKVTAPKWLCRPKYAFTVDYPEDLQLVRTVFKELLTEGDYFPLERVIQLIDERSEIRKINQHLHTGFDQ